MSFLQFNDENRRIRSDSGAQADVLNVMEAIAYDVRNGAIDYAYYRAQGAEERSLLQSPQEFLVLRNASNDQIRYKRHAGDGDKKDSVKVCICEASEGGACNGADYCDSGDGTWTTIHSGQTNMTAVAFYVSPDWDPFLVPTEDAQCFDTTSGVFDPEKGLCKSPCSADSTKQKGYCLLPNIQPRVTIAITAGRGESTVATQSTIHTRQYER